MPILRNLFGGQSSAIEPGTASRGVSIAPALVRAINASATDSGILVTPDTALTFSAVLAAIRILSESVAMLPIVLYERTGNSRNRVPADPRYRLLHDDPNPEITAYELIELSMVHLLLYGNAYCEIERTNAGDPIALWPLMPQQTRLYRAPADAGGGLIYEYSYNGTNLAGRRPTLLPAANVLHIRGVGSNGYTGLSPIQLARQQIGLGLAAETFGASYFANGGMSSGVLEYPAKLTPEQKDNIRAGWQSMNSGLRNAHRVAVLEHGMSYRQISIPAEDIQFIATRRFQIEEIARIYRIPPHMLADLERATFSNIEHLGQSFVQYSLLPWLRRFEQRANKSLLRNDAGRYYYEFIVDAIERGDLTTRTQAYATMINWGILSPNEARARENLNETEHGDQYLVPLNMIPAGAAGTFGAPAEERVPDDSGARALAPAATATKAPAMSNQRARQVATPRRRLQQTYQPLYADAAQRLMNREANDIGNQARRLFKERSNVTEFTAWLRQYYADNRNVIIDQLGAVSFSYAENIAAAAAEEIGIAVTPNLTAFTRAYIQTYADRHTNRSIASLEAALTGAADPLDALNVELEIWRQERANRIAAEESVRAGNAMARAAFETAGVANLRWVAFGDTCPYCAKLDGWIIPIASEFIAAGTEFGGGGGVKPLRVTRGVGHPPSHKGCDCQIVAA